MTEEETMANQKPYQRKRSGSKISKIVVDRDLCIGAASCIAVTGATFQFDSENKAIVMDADAADDATLMAAAQSCPTKAIFLYDKDGKQVFPK